MSEKFVSLSLLKPQQPAFHLMWARAVPKFIPTFSPISIYVRDESNKEFPCMHWEESPKPVSLSPFSSVYLNINFSTPRAAVAPLSNFYHPRRESPSLYYYLTCHVSFKFFMTQNAWHTRTKKRGKIWVEKTAWCFLVYYLLDIIWIMLRLIGKFLVAVHASAPNIDSNLHTSLSLSHLASPIIWIFHRFVSRLYANYSSVLLW
jgi:hypothetical protein